MNFLKKNTALKLMRFDSEMHNTAIAQPAQEKILSARAGGKWERNRRANGPHWIVMQNGQPHRKFATVARVQGGPEMRMSECCASVVAHEIFLDIPFVQG